MPLDVTNLIIGNAVVYRAAYGTTPPADSVAAGGAWPVGWTKVGFTNEPLKLAYEYEVAAPNIQEALGDVKRVKTSESATLETVLGEFDLDLVELAWGGDASTTAAGASQVGKQEYVLGGARTLPELAWGFEGEYVAADGDVHPVRVFIWKGTAIAGGELEFSKEDFTGLPLQIGALLDLTKTKGQQFLKIQKVTAEATS